MLKGVNKKVVEVVETENEFFEKAILFIKAEQQEKDERTLRQRAADYVHTIRYTPRSAFSVRRLGLWCLKFGMAAAAGAAMASLWLH